MTLNNKEKQDTWLNQVVEPILEPNLPIIDPHHHLWPSPLEENKIPVKSHYLLEDLWKDTESGHNIIKTIFVECGQGYYKTGPELLKPVGETEFVLGIAKKSRENTSKAQISGIVGHADLMLGKSVKETLEAHQEKGEGLFKGVRHTAGWDQSEEIRNSHSKPIRHIYLDDDFQDGVEQLEKLEMSLDAWHYHTQIKELTLLAKTFPNLIIIHNHFGGPLGIGPYEGNRDKIFNHWKEDIFELSGCKNVVSKLGGMAMPINGWDWHKRNKPATSNELVLAQKEYYLHVIDSFGSERCLFESNFPVDKQSISYPVLWNAFKKLTFNFSEKDKNQLFYETAARVYKI